MQSPHLVSPHHFVHSPLLLTLSVAVTTPLIPHRLQADNSAFRDGMFAHTPGLLKEIKETHRVPITTEKKTEDFRGGQWRCLRF